VKLTKQQQMALGLALIIFVGYYLYTWNRERLEVQGDNVSIGVIVYYTDGTMEEFESGRQLSVWSGGKQVYAIEGRVKMYLTYTGTPQSWAVNGVVNTLFDGVKKKSQTIPKPSSIPSGSSTPLITVKVLASEIQTWDNGQFAQHTLQFTVPSFSITVTFTDGNTDSRSASASSSTVGLGVEPDSGITKLNVSIEPSSLS